MIPQPSEESGQDGVGQLGSQTDVEGAGGG